MTKVGFTGPYADVNFGDYAMLVNNIAALGLDAATIFSYDDGFLEKLVTDYFPMVTPTIVGVDLEPLPDGRGLTERPITGLEVLALLRNEAALRVAIEPLDVLVVNGGGYLNELWARPHRQMRLLQILAPAMLAAEMGKRVVFSANGIGPFSASSIPWRTSWLACQTPLCMCGTSCTRPCGLVGWALLTNRFTTRQTICFRLKTRSSGDRPSCLLQGLGRTWLWRPINRSTSCAGTWMSGETLSTGWMPTMGAT